MSDYNSSLPIRTENNGDVVSKICDATTTSNQLAVTSSGHIGVDISDGAGTALTSTLNAGKQSLDVNITGGSSSGATTDQSTFTYGSSTETPVGGVYQDTGATLTAGQTGAVRLTAERGMHMNLRNASGTELLGQQTMAASIPVVIASNQSSVAVTAAQSTASNLHVAISDSSGTAFSPSNPLYVTMTDVAGTPVDNYNTAASLAAGGTSNHDYTVTAAKTFYSKQILATSSGALKIEVQYETAAGSGTFNTFFVGFNSTANPDILIPIPSSKTQVAGAKIRVIRTNRDKQATDVYSTISGAEI